MRLAIMFLSGSGAKRHFAHLIGGKKPALAWRLLKRLQHGSEVALGSHWGRIGVALGWLWSRNWLPINTLCGGFEVALMWPFWFQYFSFQHFSFCQNVALGGFAGCLSGA